MLSRSAVLLTLVFCFVPLAVFANDLPKHAVPNGGLPSAAPEEVGLNPAQLEKISAMMQADVDAGHTVGTIAAIARHGKLAYFDAVGLADREAKVAMTPDAIFRIYSMTKPIVSTALMMLYEDGLFQLGDPVSKYLPELGGLDVLIEKNPIERGAPGIRPRGAYAEAPPMPDPDTYATEPARRDVTVQDLMRHTAGLTYGIFGNTSVDKIYRHYGILGDADLDEFIDDLGKSPLQYQPGTRWHYSVAVDVQGALIEALSGMPLDEFLEERMFAPLGMADTGFYVPESKMDRFTQMYVPAEGKLDVADPALSQNFVSKPGFLGGGGGLVSTTADYLRFCQMHLNGGELDGVRLLGTKTIDLMRTDHLGDVPYGNGAYGFGLGFAVMKDPALNGSVGSVGEYNWGGAAGTKFWIDPLEDMVGVYMVQILPGSGLPYGTIFKNLAYTAITD